MKLTPEGLRDFLSVLPKYESLSLADRRALASIERPSQSCSSYVLRDSLEALIAAGFLLPPAPNSRCSVEPSRHEFIRTLRLLRAHPVLHNPSQGSFESYAKEHFTTAERDALRNNPNVDRGELNLTLYRRVTAPDWVQDFLSAGDRSWESSYLPRGALAMFANPEVLSCAQNVVRWLIAHGGRVALRDLPALAASPELLSEALHACLRYALLFAAIDPESMDTFLGIWPTAMADPALAQLPPPRNVTPTETFDPLFLIEDMTSLLVVCATDPPRMKVEDHQMYAKTGQTLANNLRPLPKWVEEAFYMTCDHRIGIAEEFVRHFGLVEVGGYPPQMTVGDRGRAWLGLGIGDRLRVVMDCLLERKQTLAAFHNIAKGHVSLTGSRFHINTRMSPQPDIPTAILQAFRSLPGDGFLLTQEIAAFSQPVNPFLAIYRKDKNAYVSSDAMYIRQPDAEALQKAWSGTLHTFLRLRLLPLGGIRVGRGEEGVSIAITPAGRYYLSQTREWERSAKVDSQVIVQPNFEVTFLGEAAAAEAEIGRFAERRGRQIGALFQITKKSIFAAAGAGMTAEGVLATLERVCTREVPANVRREIQGWFAQCRKVSFEAAMLIRCPDRETALRVLGLAKGSATALSDTILEYRDPGRQRPGLIKKLKELGVLASVQEPPGERQWERW
jgi:hypothetical protein